MRISLLYANYCYLKHKGLLYLLIAKVHINLPYNHKMFCTLSLNILYTFSGVYGAYFFIFYNLPFEFEYQACWLTVH